MKKFSLFLLWAFIAVLTVACEKEKQTDEPTPSVEAPELFVNEEVISASAQGGVCQIAYLISNPVAGATVVVTSDQNWVSNFDYSTDGVVKMEVAPNLTNEARNANLLLKYNYGEGLSLEQTLIVHQHYAYDYYTEMSYGSGGYFYGRGYGHANYALYLTTLPTEDGYFVGGSEVFRLDFSAEDPTDYRSIRLPEGTYTEEDMDLFESYWGKVNATGDAWEITAFIVDVELTVTYTDDVLQIEGTIVDFDGKVHFVSYRGNLTFDLYSAEGYQLINYDIETQGTVLVDSVTYVAGNEEVMRLKMQLAGTPEGGNYSNPYVMLYIDLYAPIDDYKILSGEYQVTTTQDPYTVGIGYVDQESYYAMGTYALDVQSGNSTILALVEDGTITFTDNGDGTYAVDCELYTAQGFKVSSQYVGELPILNIPGSGFSTLEGDYEVDLSQDIRTFAYYSGDDYEIGAGCFTIQLTGPFEQEPDTYLTSGRGEEVYLELVAASLDNKAGVPTGTYTVADPSAPQAGQFIPGRQDEVGQGNLWGTHYVGGYKDGFIDVCAPAVGGQLEVTNHGDGTYDLEFAFKDDLGHTWSGSWSGKITFYDFDYAPEQQQQVVTPKTYVLNNWADCFRK